MDARKAAVKKGAALGYRLAAKLFNGIYPERNRNPILISGSPRGGTTWIAESIARMHGTSRVLWEPLQEGNPDKHACGFSKRPYVDETTITPQIEAFFRRLLRGTMVNRHTLRLNKQPEHRASLFRNEQLVIKFVRGNGVLSYLRRAYQLPKPLVVIRHPCAVVASQLNMGKWEDHPYIAPRLYEIYPHLKSVVDPEAPLHQRLAMTWAADVLHARSAADDVQIVYYEDVVLNRLKALEPVLQEWGWDLVPTELDSYLDAPSSSHKRWTQLDSTETKLARWKQELDEKKASDIIKVVRSMGIEEYNTMPVPKKYY